MFRKTNIFVFIVLAALCVLLLTACGQTANNSQNAEPEKEKQESNTETADHSQYKVALVLPGTINDEGWNATAYRGLELTKEAGFETAYSENVKTSDYEAVYRGYASKGYNLIIGHGFNFLDPAKAVAADFPQTMFAVTSTVEYADPNVFAIDTNSSDAGFLAGVLAAKMTKTKVVAVPCGLEIPGIIRYATGFKQGVEYVNPEIKVLSSYTGSSSDTAQLKELTAAMVKQGADIIAPNADQAGLGAFEYVKEHKDLRIIGVYGDQKALAPDQILTSAIIDMPGAIEQVAELGFKGQLEAKAYVFGVKEGSVWLTDFSSDVPQDVQDLLKDVIEKIKNNEIEVKYVLE